ncbi:DUF5050 domain-containing protein [Pontimicrobium sp. SW4]|uniref:DUF5050 domain-containing protein n=1 Tax=Pontimicrobium sp. SW4 TaxID=3153519 RepID=A0AAU7BV20_9FLAO
MKNKTILFLLYTFCSISSFSQSYEMLITKQQNNNDNIYLINEEGLSKIITKHKRKDSSPVMSPNGEYIVFTSERVGWWKIWLLNLKTNTYKQLTDSKNAEYFPSWSPNSKEILFISSRNGSSQIFKMDANGKSQQNLTDDNKAYATPSWGKDNKIYYSIKMNGAYQIARMNPDGTKKEVLTNSNGNKLMPQLSNDKTQLLYYGDASGNLEIYVLNLKQNKTTQLTNHPLMDMRARWSYDDKKIIFERGNKGSNHHIYIMDSNGSNVKKLTNNGYNYAASFTTTSLKM